MSMPDFEDLLDGVCTIIDWIEDVNTLTEAAPEDDDDTAMAWDEMGDWPLEGEEDEDE